MPTALPAGCRVLAYQKELAPDTGRLHVQGYIAMNSSTKVTGFMKALGLDHKQRNVWHVEPRNGTEQQAIDYCSKLDTRVPGTKSLNMYDLDWEDSVSWSDFCKVDNIDYGKWRNDVHRAWSDEELTGDESY